MSGVCFQEFNLHWKKNDLNCFCLKVKQVKCFEFLLNKKDVLAVLPTGYGKSLLYQLLPFVIPTRKQRNIVIVVSPLNSIMEDQINVLSDRGLSASVLRVTMKAESESQSLFAPTASINYMNNVSSEIKTGNIDFLYGHPECLLSEEGRTLLKSKVYQENVAAIVIDEAHCVELWGAEFRKDYHDVVALRAVLPGGVMLALTATAPKSLIQKIKETLCIKNCEVVTASPNRPNIFLTVHERLSHCHGIKSYSEILQPIAKELLEKRESYPLTIIYMGLKYCGYAFQLFDMVIENSFCGSHFKPCERLFAQFHASTTPQMKEDVLAEIKKKNSRIRVIFATTALGMGVDAPEVTEIIHIGPPSNLETYIQEIGRAGRTGKQSNAILYYNKNDVSSSKVNTDQSMKDYCQEVGCLRKFLITYFGFSFEQQAICCSNCNVEISALQINVEESEHSINHEEKYDMLSIQRELEKLESNDGYYNLLPFAYTLDENAITCILNNISDVQNESHLLHKVGVWDERIAAKIYEIIKKHKVI